MTRQPLRGPGFRLGTAQTMPATEADTKEEVQAEEELWLLGQPPLWRYLEFVEHSVVGGRRADSSALAKEWQAANDYYQELERCEAGIANCGAHRELDPELLPLAELVKASPCYKRAFDILPTTFREVELDKLIVFQKHVTRTFAERMVRRLGPKPDPNTLFRFCLPVDTAVPPVEVCRLGSHRYVFRCGSTDMRYHETVLLKPEQIPGYHSFGPVAGMLGVVVGFGCSFMNAVCVGNRMLLHNGYHRACALRSLGVTHAPCIVAEATRVDEVQLAIKSLSAEEVALYFESARPPLLKDFFEPRIRKLLPLCTQTHLVEVTLEIRHLAENPLTSE